MAEIIDEHYVVADVSGAKRKINTDLLVGQPLESGSWVLIHVGFALAIIDDNEAKQTLDLLNEMQEVYQQELEALAISTAHKISEKSGDL